MTRKTEIDAPQDASAELYGFENVCAVRNGVSLLHDISFTLRRGECAAILGANGSGKSTLMKLMTGDLHPSVTDIPAKLRIFGDENYSARAIKRKIGVITGDLQEKFKTLAPQCTGFETVMSGALNMIGILYPELVTPALIEKTKIYVGRYGLGAVADRPFEALSCGEAMRCLIARAMIAEPCALLLDEPLNGLDLTAKRDFLQGLKISAQAGASVILITHRIEEIIPQISRIILLKDGKIFADGRKEEILTSERMSALFSVPVQIMRSRESYAAFLD